MKRILLILVLIALPLTAFAGSFSSDDVRPQMTKDDKRLVPVIDAHIRNTRGWMISDYTIEPHSRDGDIVVFTVWYNYGDGVSKLVTNNGRSFRIFVDTKTRRVLKEQFF